ncbi:MAG: membrane protein insertion efficiency factor YidD [Burkholderiales bacterium]
MSLLAASPVPRSVVQRVLIGAVKFYRLMLSPWLGSSCRFEPTCSAYALKALESHGAATGAYLSARRLLRCHPWCAGGCDLVPDDRHTPTFILPSTTPMAADLLEKNPS